MSNNKTEIIKLLGKMSVLEIVDLVSEIEQTFGITANDLSQIYNQQNTNSKASTTEEQTEFNVNLNNIGNNKIAVIRVVRNLLALGLKEAKDLVEAAPILLKEGINKATAETFKTQLEEVGATIEIK